MGAMTRDQLVEEIKTRWLAGVSGGDIAKALGVTKNTVVGLVQRRGWTRTDSMAKASADALAKANTARARAAPRPVRPAPKPALKIVGNSAVFHEDPEQREPRVIAREVGAVPGSLGLRIIDSGFTGCKWPISTHGNDGAETRFCCAPRVEGKPYCRFHGEVATTGPTYGNGRKVPDAKELIRSLRRFA